MDAQRRPPLFLGAHGLQAAFSVPQPSLGFEETWRYEAQGEAGAGGGGDGVRVRVGVVTQGSHPES